MFRKYLWFALRVNLLSFGIMLGLGLFLYKLFSTLSRIFALELIPLEFYVFLPLLFILFLIIPLFFAFKWLYKKTVKKDKLKLKETIIFSVIVMVLINFLLETSNVRGVNFVSFAIYQVIGVVITSLIFYFAGRKYAPKS